MKRVYFVRHGETVGNKERFFQTFDTELTENGHEGAKRVGERLSHVELDVLIASPMKRAQQTAEHIAKHTGLSLETFHDFHEHLQAESMRGKSHDAPEASDFIDRKKYIEHFLAPEPVLPGFENFSAVMKRMQSCTDFLKSHQSKNILVVSHAAFIHSLTAFLVLQEKEVEPRLHFDIGGSFGRMSNVAITEFIYDEGMWQLYTWNDDVHYAT